MKKIGVLFTLFLVIICAPYPVHAQAGITTSTSTDVRFPTDITFSLEAGSSADITQIFLRYRVEMITTVRVTSVTQLEFLPARDVETSWTWEMKKMLGSLPPGAEIQYSWRIVDAAGRELETEWDTVRFDDNNHPWKSLDAEIITLYWYQGDTALARALLDSANGALVRLTRDTGIQLVESVQLYIYASSDALLDALLYPQEWSGGVSFSAFGTILLHATDSNLEWGMRIIAHEIAHVITYSMTYNPYGDLPTWLEEGLSTYAEGDLRGDFRYSLDTAISGDSLIPLMTLSSNFPVDYGEALLSYAESYSAVNFLIDRYGRDKFITLLDTFKQGASYDDAFMKVYGADTHDLDNQWRLSLGLQPRERPEDAFPQATPPPVSGNGLCGCQAGSGTSGFGGIAGFAILCAMLMPGISEIVIIKVRKGKKKK